MQHAKMPLAKSLLSSYLENMPAKGSYCHIYNKGVEGRDVFSDSQDYDIFRAYLLEYLGPLNKEAAKKTFTVHGRTFQGTPHLPKNYFNRVKLVTFSLMPDHFHLILKENTKGSLQSFMRSLTTRYSMYFNKKYQRSGSLFQGSYKSAWIENEAQLTELTRYIAHKSDHGGDQLPEAITLEKENKPLERSIPKSKPTHLKPLSRIPEILGSLAVFLLLLGLGIRNITITTAKNIAESPAESPAVLSESIEPSPSPSPKAKTMLIVKKSLTSNVSIRMEPTQNSNKIGEVKPGETYEYVSVNSGWLEIKLSDGSTGFIYSDYVDILE